MSQNILGIDLGTSSIGISLRNPNIQGNLSEQLEYFSVDVFNSGVGKDDKAREYSYAANRSANRRTRRLYDIRRRRLWETLELLIENNLCPLSMESLDTWRHYDKSRGGYSRQYPVEEKAFENWIRLDFNNNGEPDYESPYHLRRDLACKFQLDLDNQEDRYKLGRALYHIAQRRGFKSSKGNKAETADGQQDSTETALSEELKASELKKSRKLIEYMEQNGFKTVACAFADLIDKGIRIRASQYEATRLDYMKEINEIFMFQDNLSLESNLYKRLLSQKKGEGTIFYKKPLASQKGNVGKCTLEKNKTRCPICHPVFEEFRAFSFINNIRYKITPDTEWISLTPAQVENIYDKLFTSRVSKSFKFKEIRALLEQSGLILSKENGTINYGDNVSVAGCPITARLIKLFGDDWNSISIIGKKERQNHAKQDRSFHIVKHTAESIWNFCYNADEPEDVERFSTECLGWDTEQTKKLIRLWDDMQPGYAMLSQKAMKNINRFLRLGLRYPDAVMLAKVPDIFMKYDKNIGDKDISEIIKEYNEKVKAKNTTLKTYANIANTLISSYKSLDYTERNDDRLYDYVLQESDIDLVKKKCKSFFGEIKWNSFSEVEKDIIIVEVADRYQSFFYDRTRDYIKVPKLSDDLFSYLKEKCHNLTDADKTKLYHPSMISTYRPISSSDSERDWQLGSPNMGSIKNPVALRTLNILRNKINQLLSCHLIDPEDTRIIIETTRRKGDILDDANVRRAISHYQTQRENERAEIKKIIAQYFPERGSEEDIDKALYLVEQLKHDDWQTPYFRNEGKKKGTFDGTYSKYIQKYKLWLQQDCRCLYTGNIINIHNLFSDVATDTEHTIPRSLSFDNSDANLTVCDAYYNRKIKKNRIPTELENYEKDAIIGGKMYTAIKPRLKKWEEKVEHLENMVDYWKRRSLSTSTKEDKDFCIVNRHEWQMELDYWRNKLDRFTRKDIPDGFRNSQLVDTGIITRHAIAYLKSVFNNVVAEKGSVTADFRKILGLQSVEEKKDRTKHSHHAIDATILTIIPVAGLREEILKLYYQKEEARKLEKWNEVKYYERLLREKVCQLNIGGGISKINDFINKNILINHRNNDRALQNAKRRQRIRGKVIRKQTSDGTYKERFIDGDSIRLELSAAGNLGAILLPKQDADGNYVKKNGKYQYSRDDKGQNTYTMVQRVDIKSFKKIEDLEKIIDPIVRQSIKTTVELILKSDSQKSLASILSGDIWIRDKKGKGEEIKHNKYGKPISPIRHVRCKVAAGRGFLRFESAIPLREQKYISHKPLYNLNDRDHKKYVYAQNTGNYLCLVYEGIFKGKIHREFEFISNYEAAKLKHFYKREGANDINSFEQLKTKLMQEPNFMKKTFTSRGKDVECTLTAIIRTGDRVLKWNNTPEELYELSRAELIKRLYVVVKFNTTGANLIYLNSHLSANSDNLEKLTSNNFNCMIEHRDFEIRLTEKGDTILFHD